MSESLRIFKLTKNVPTNMILFNFFCKLLVFVSKRAIERIAQKNERFAHFLFNHEQPEQSLFRHEQPERFAHNCSFVMSNLSNFLTVPHFS